MSPKIKNYASATFLTDQGLQEVFNEIGRGLEVRLTSYPINIATAAISS